MDGETSLAAPLCGSAPAQQSQESIRQLTAETLAHLADGSALLQRCKELQRRNPRDLRIVWLVARILDTNAGLGKQANKLVLPPRRKAKSKRAQPLDVELNSPSSISSTTGPR